jgi:hypothetical protein
MKTRLIYILKNTKTWFGFLKWKKNPKKLGRFLNFVPLIGIGGFHKKNENPQH